MIIKSIKLTNFRNHTQYELTCTDETSLILGKNGCGKTSVLEAIYILTRGKSFRATDPDILKHGTDFYRAELEYINGEKTTATFDGENKNFTVSSKKTKRLPKKNQYPVVLFLPSDLNLVSGSPSKRRDYFDRIFGQFSEKYSNSLLRYNKALKQRNELLKQDHLSSDSMFSWNVLLAKYGSEISNLRKEFVAEINQSFTDTYRTIAQNSDQIQIIIDSDLKDTSESSYLKILENNYQKDFYLGHTSFGIHRDDFIFYFNNQIADGSASRGETRSMILALKFIEAKLLQQKLGKKPLILLDDVFSELDDTRRKCLVDNFKDNQVIITSTEGTL